MAILETTHEETNVVKLFYTSDGKEFKYKEDAERHEQVIEARKTIERMETELVSKIINEERWFIFPDFETLEEYIKSVNISNNEYMCKSHIDEFKKLKFPCALSLDFEYDYNDNRFSCISIQTQKEVLSKADQLKDMIYNQSRFFYVY